MSEIKNGRLGLYGTKHSKCNHMTTLGFKLLTRVEQIVTAVHTETCSLAFTDILMNPDRVLRIRSA